MKKLVSLLLVFLLVCPFAAFALEGTYTRPEIEPNDNNIKSGEFLLGGTTDAVTVEGATVTITTEDGLVFTYTEPENVFAITQSVIASAQYLEKFYDDPGEQITQYIKNGTHLELIGFTSDGYVHAFFHDLGSDVLAAAIGDAATLSTADADAVANMLEGQLGCKFEYGTLGGNVWFVGDALKTGKERVYFNTWVNGREVHGYAYFDGNATLQDAYDMLAPLTISGK